MKASQTYHHLFCNRVAPNKSNEPLFHFLSIYFHFRAKTVKNFRLYVFKSKFGRGRASPAGVALVQKGLRESGRGCVSPAGVARVQKVLRESGRGPASPEGVARVRKGL